jgi:hypothetical protein
LSFACFHSRSAVSSCLQQITSLSLKNENIVSGHVILNTDLTSKYLVLNWSYPGRKFYDCHVPLARLYIAYQLNFFTCLRLMRFDFLMHVLFSASKLT